MSESVLSKIKAVGSAVLYLLFFVFGSGFASLVCQVLGLDIVASSAIAAVFVLLSLAVFMVVKKGNVRIRLNLNRIKPLYLVLIVPLTVAVTFIVQSVQFLIPGLFTSLESYSALSGNLPLDILSVVVLSPITEELFFRGLMLTRLRGNFPVTVSIIITSSLFGLMHMSPGWIIIATLIGVYYAVLATKLKSVYAPIVAHMTSNAMSIIFYLLAKQ